MKKILLFFVAMLTCCGAVHANPISVRSGEHPTFTRLVMPLPENSSWKIENQVGRSTLILDNFSHGFDLTFAFDIIPRTRLSELVGEESELVMQLNCDCQVNAFVEENGFLVVDISDGPDFILLPEPENLSSQLPKSSYSYGDLLWNGVQNSIVEIDTDVQLPSLMDTGELNAEHSGEAPSEIVSLTRDRLVTAFADAATRGLIDTDQGSLLEIQSENETAPEQEIFDSSNVQTMESATITGNIRVTNSKDVPNAPAQPGTGVSGSTCPNPEIVNIAEWGSELSFAAQMGQANIDLVDELGRYRKDEVLKRIKLYLFFGFGAEAAQTIKLVNYLGKDYPELVDLSNIMEYGYAKNPRLLHRFADCDSDLALWGILSAQEVPLEDRKSVV